MTMDGFADCLAKTFQGEEASVGLISPHDGNAGCLPDKGAGRNARPLQHLGTPEDPGVAQPFEQLQTRFKTDDIAISPRAAARDRQAYPAAGGFQQAVPHDALQIDRQFRSVGPAFRRPDYQTLKADHLIGRPFGSQGGR